MEKEERKGKKKSHAAEVGQHRGSGTEGSQQCWVEQRQEEEKDKQSFLQSCMAATLQAAVLGTGIMGRKSTLSH